MHDAEKVACVYLMM